MATIHPFIESELSAAATILRQGGVVIVPTDTVYGLVCHPDFPEALERIRQMKHRDREKPFQKLAASESIVWADGALKTTQSERFAAYWPGALTLVMDTEDGRTEGYRVPDGILLRQLLELCGGMLCATSVNISGEPPADAVEKIPDSIREAVDALLDGGAIPTAEASTVLQVKKTGEVIVLRRGALLEQMSIA